VNSIERKTRQLVTVGALVGSVAMAAPSGAERWSLGDVLRYALERAPEIGSARLERASADDRVANAVGRLLPSLDVSGSVGVEERSGVAAGSPWTSGLGMTLTERLYDNGTTLIQWRQSKVSRELAELSLRRVRDALCLSVATAYYRFALASRLADVRSDQLRMTEGQFTTVRQLYRQGLRARRDFLRFEAEVQRARISLRQAEIAVESSRADLVAAMGRGRGEPDVAFRVVEPPLDMQDGEPVVPATAPPVENTYAVREAALRAQIAPFPAELARRQYWPTVDVTLGAGYGSPNFLVTGGPLPVAGLGGRHETRVSALLTVTFNVWDWGIRRRDVAIADRDTRIAEKALERARLDATAETTKLVLDLEQLKMTYAMSRSLVDSQQEIFGFLDRDYREGRVTPVDLIQNFRDLLEARISVLEARTQLAIGVLRYHFLSADLAAHLGVGDDVGG
jgi:outer membrane protein TolC